MVAKIHAKNVGLRIVAAGVQRARLFHMTSAAGAVQVVAVVIVTVVIDALCVTWLVKKDGRFIERKQQEPLAAGAASSR